MLENRDEILKMDDASLSRLCELEFFKGTGNGGQKRAGGEECGDTTSETIHESLLIEDFY